MSVRLADLEPSFCTILTPGRVYQEHDDFATADGIRFLCPKCFLANGGAMNTHSVLCWKPRVPQSEEPRPGRWEMQGTGYSDLTLVAGSSSVSIGDGCAAHFFVRDGAIEMC